MKWRKSLALAFHMYSKLPAPPADWEGPHRQYVLCFFPLVGWVIGGLELLWWYLVPLLRLSPLLTGAAACAIPLLVTGAIHLDGYMDACDALASHQSKEKMLEIMQDSHIGAFAPICLGLWLMAAWAGWGEVLSIGLTLRQMACLCLVFPLERACSGWFCVTLPNARGSGLLFHFTQGGRPGVVRGALLLQVIVYAGCMFLLSPALALWVVPAGAAALLWFRGMLGRRFGGGITGDLAGWFLQVFELACLLGAAVYGGVMGCS